MLYQTSNGTLEATSRKLLLAYSYPLFIEYCDPYLAVLISTD